MMRTVLPALAHAIVMNSSPGRTMETLKEMLQVCSYTISGRYILYLTGQMGEIKEQQLKGKRVKQVYLMSTNIPFLYQELSAAVIEAYNLLPNLVTFLLH